MGHDLGQRLKQHSTTGLLSMFRVVVEMQSRGFNSLGRNSAIQSQATPSQDVSLYSRFYPQHSNAQFAGIAIDALAVSHPTEPRYNGVFGKRHTSMVTVSNCQFRFLGCGVITKPSGGQGADAQGDYLLVNDCNFQY